MLARVGLRIGRIGFIGRGFGRRNEEVEDQEEKPEYKRTFTTRTIYVAAQSDGFTRARNIVLAVDIGVLIASGYLIQKFILPSYYYTGMIGFGALAFLMFAHIGIMDMSINDTISRIDLSEDQSKVIVYTAANRSKPQFSASISGIETTLRKDTDGGLMEIYSVVFPEDQKKSYNLVLVNVEEVNDAVMQNKDILQDVLNGDARAVKQYKYLAI